MAEPARHAVGRQPEEHERCTARNTQRRRCGGWKAYGTDVCYVHGARAPQVRRAAERRQQEAAARQAVVTYGLPQDVSPTEALLQEIHATAGHVAWLRDLVGSLETSALVWGPASETEFALPAATTDDAPAEVGSASRREVVSRAGVNVWLRLYQAERKHLVEVSAEAIRCGIEERRVKLAESQGALIADLIKRLLDDPTLGLSTEQRQLGRRIASNHLRALAGAGAGAA